jgi:dihydrofolate reductase
MPDQNRQPKPASTEIVLIAAVAEKNRVIGDGLSLPWHIPEDLRRFKRLTTGHPLIMGRRTFESLLKQFGGPLPDRQNVVLTRHPERVKHEGVHVHTSLDDALSAFEDAPVIFIGGGAKVYEETLPSAHRLELTLVEGDHTGDTYFPPYEHLIGPVFECARSDQHEGYRFETYVRREVW